MYAEAERLAEETGGHYLDQFTNAERATDWRGNNNIAESIFEQMRHEPHPIPEWIVVGAGTGGTSATIGRYIRYRRYPTRLCVVDPENSAFFPSYAQGRRDVVTGASSRIEGIGRPRVEPSFLPDVVDRMIVVPDAASVAAARHVSAVLGRRVGPSTGTNLWGAFGLLAEMVRRRAQRIGGDADRRQRRPLRRHLLRRRVADQLRAWTRQTAAGVLVEFERSGPLALIVGALDERARRRSGTATTPPGRRSPHRWTLPTRSSRASLPLCGYLPSLCITTPTIQIHPAAWRDLRRQTVSDSPVTVRVGGPISIWQHTWRGAIRCRGFTRGVAQLGSALRSGRRGRGFESRHPDSRRRRSEALTRKFWSGTFSLSVSDGMVG